MVKQIKIGMLALAVAGFFASCGGNDAAKDAAKEELTAAPAMDASAASTPDAAAMTAPAGPTTTMTFEETEFQFGTVEEGEMVKHTYKFKNTGSEPLTLTNARGSCGCTVPVWPKEPIAPGESGEVTVEFNSQGKAGDRNQIVTITANTNPVESQIFLKGKVNPKAGQTAVQ